jgi:hypothetical protein
LRVEGAATAHRKEPRGRDAGEHQLHSAVGSYLRQSDGLTISESLLLVDGNSWINRGISLEAEVIQTAPTSLNRRSWNGQLSPA